MDNPIKMVDVAIVGGGAAGMSAALWCDELGLDSVLIEEHSELGGQLRQIYNPIENYPGLATADGREMLSRFEKSLALRNFGRRIGIKVTSIDFSAMQIRLAHGALDAASVACKTIILATGVRRRRLQIPGEGEFLGRGILGSGSRDKHLVAGKRVMIIGGGDAAFENASILSEFAQSVIVLYRKSEPTAREEFVTKAGGLPNVRLVPSTRVKAIRGGVAVTDVELLDASGNKRTEQVDAILIRIGVEPNAELAADALERDDAGYIKVDQSGRTSLPYVYAIGDVANPSSPTLSTAAGSGATAAKSIFQLLATEKGYNTARIQR